jgi:hypothetical protein
VFALLGVTALDFGVLQTAVLMTMPYVILSLLLFHFLEKTRLNAFVIALIIAAFCLTSYGILTTWLNSPTAAGMFRGIQKW